MILIELIEARRNLWHRCKELFTDEKIAEQIYRYLCEGLEECENKKDTFFQGWAWNNSNTTAYNQLPVNENRSLCKLRHGAKMEGHFEEPEINPCRGCEDYDGKGGCISNGGCGAKMDEVSG